MTLSIASARGVERAANFNAGPGALPLAVLERIREELLDYRGTGMSVMEMSHRSAEFEEIIARAEQNLRKLMGIPEEYAVIFVQGGGSAQFTMAPLNLCLPGKPVDMLHTGMWTGEGAGGIEARNATPDCGFNRGGEIYAAAAQGRNSAGRGRFVRLYVHEQYDRGVAVDMATGNGGRAAGGGYVVGHYVATGGRAEVWVDFCGGAEEFGSFGRDGGDCAADLAERADKNLPTVLQYRTHIKERSLYHTPPTFAVYIVGLVLEWIEAEGGVVAIEKRNDAKAKLLYGAIDSSSGYYVCPIEKDSRSTMNVTFRVAGGNEEIEKKFAAEAAANKLIGLGGHRSVGGMRASIYNAVTIETVEVLVKFMREFQKANG